MESQKHSISLILLAGGIGKRMGHAKPKQYLPLNNKMIALHSFDIFLNNSFIKEIIVVCEDEYQVHFKQNCPAHYPLSFAKPGKRRQDSLYSGLSKVQNENAMIAVHDSARPFVPCLNELIRAAFKYGAAVLASPMKFTVKESTPSGFVSRTLKRESLWEIQTPQMAFKDLFMKGFEIANDQQLTVTDDVSLVELVGHPVKIVEGPNSNFKITTFEDMAIATQMIENLINDDTKKPQLQTPHCV
ncbi:MAG: 2-C-methyl-D-erythritol 4-phosphate cytidylyltransferase [Parachlamydiales bacterium]|nr:2-C-methyl-D-erythritol 4-phosphate cytidylyltransferase [Parachlamydiales bacterium]